MAWTLFQGHKAEAQAQKFLQKQGLKHLKSNYRCRLGEIDLIMQHKQSLVFVEVRQRNNANYGGALASVDRHKQAKLIKAAEHYLLHHPWDGPCRFDVVGLTANQTPEWIQNAFQT